MLKLFLMLHVLSGIGLVSAQTVSGERSTPNVIIIMADDMGYGDIGYHDNPFIETPELDALAVQSAVFSNFYVSPVCAPTRASLLTGRYNIRTGVFDTYSGGAIMATEETTIAEIFKSQGYNTGMFGKWHLGDSYPSRPQDQGFDTSVWHLSGGIGQIGDVFNYYKYDRSYFDPMLYKNGEIFQSEGYCSDVFTNEAIKFIEQQNGQPFLAYLSFNAPHTPLQVPERYEKIYTNTKISSEYFNNRGVYSHIMSGEDIKAARKVYAMVSNIDDNIGRLIKMLKAQNLYDNTIIIFMTDNGPEQHRYTGGFRGRKGQVREGGIHVPFFMKLPQNIQHNKVVSVAAAHIDVLPTLAGLCGIGLNKGTDLDGLDLGKFIGSEAQSLSRPLFFEWQRSFPEKYRNMAVIRDGYKLIGNVNKESGLDQFELYHLVEDPFETRDISKENPGILKQLKDELDAWYDDIMKSPHINNLPRIIIGSDEEVRTVLNRNDARGMQLIWDDDQMHVSWDLSIVKAGNYKVVCHFRNPVPKTGQMFIRFGIQNFTRDINEKDLQTIVFDKVFLNEGDCSLDGWFLAKDITHYTPFYIEIVQL